MTECDCAGMLLLLVIIVFPLFVTVAAMVLSDCTHRYGDPERKEATAAWERMKRRMP